MKPVRVLVCGTNYGRAYLDAMALGGGDYKLAGILARGSLRSEQTAARYGTPLYRRVEDLPSGIDMACAAMGPAGGESVLRLLERRIHVLSEHPQESGFVRKALAAAKAHRACFHINGHFANLDAAAAFIAECVRLRPKARPAFLDVTATDRSLVATLDILRRAVKTFEPFRFDVKSRSLPFTIIQGELGGLPATLHVQCFGGPDRRFLEDGSPGYLVDFRITAGFPTGVLTLMAIGGPVVWTSNLSRAGLSDNPLWTWVYKERTRTSRGLKTQKARANLLAMNSLVRNARGGAVPPEQKPEHLLGVARVWETIGRMLYAGR